MEDKKHGPSDFLHPGLVISEREVQMMASAWVTVEESLNEDSSDSMSLVDEALTYGAESNPEICLDVILKICALTNKKKLLVRLGCGVLEELMAASGSKLSSKVIHEYQANASFKIALDHVYLDEKDNGYSVVKELIGNFKYA